MTKEELMEIIDIEHGSDFTFFENLASLIEADEMITADAIFQVMAEVDMEFLADILEVYFSDIMENMPDDIDVYNMLEAEKRNLLSMIEAVKAEEDGALSKISDELEKFHEHFSISELCEIIDNDKSLVKPSSLRDAIYDYRASKLSNGNRDYNISPAAEYEISEYIVPLGELS